MDTLWTTYGQCVPNYGHYGHHSMGTYKKNYKNVCCGPTDDNFVPNVPNLNF